MSIPELGPKYNLIESLGRGAVSEVFSARRIEDDRAIALKVLHQDPSVFLSVMEKEANMYRSLGPQPGFLEGYSEVLEHDGKHFFEVELHRGITLYNEMSRVERFPWNRAVDIVIKVCEALEILHGKGFIHCDIKPGNIMLGEGDEPTIFDLGSARPIDQPLFVPGGETFMGSASYLPPEVLDDVVTGACADIYSLGIVLSELLYGTLPISIERFTLGQLFRRAMSKQSSEEQAEEDPLAVITELKRNSSPILPMVLTDRGDALQDIIRKAIDREWKHRFSSADEFKVALVEWSEKEWPDQ